MKLEELMSDDIIGVSQLYIVLVRGFIFLSSDSCIGIKLINVSYSVRNKVALAKWKLQKEEFEMQASCRSVFIECRSA